MKFDSKFISFLLRLGVAFAFIYAGLAALLNPDAWIGFLPIWLQSANLLHVMSVYQILLAIWLLSDKQLYYSSILAALTIGGIIVLNFGSLDIVFRDVPILLVATALAIINKKKLSFVDYKI
jgi:hypothetical protein